MARGDADPIKVFGDPPAEIETAKVLDLLLAVSSIGRVRANKPLKHTGIPPGKTVGGLTARQRHELVDWLRISGQTRSFDER